MIQKQPIYRVVTVLHNHHNNKQESQGQLDKGEKKVKIEALFLEWNERNLILTGILTFISTVSGITSTKTSPTVSCVAAFISKRNKIFVYSGMFKCIFFSARQLVNCALWSENLEGEGVCVCIKNETLEHAWTGLANIMFGHVIQRWMIRILVCNSQMFGWIPNQSIAGISVFRVELWKMVEIYLLTYW